MLWNVVALYACDTLLWMTSHGLSLWLLVLKRLMRVLPWHLRLLPVYFKGWALALLSQAAAQAVSQGPRASFGLRGLIRCSWSLMINIMIINDYSWPRTAPQRIPSEPSSNIPRRHGLLSASSGCGTSRAEKLTQLCFYKWKVMKTHNSRYQETGALLSKERLKEFQVCKVGTFLAIA